MEQSSFKSLPRELWSSVAAFLTPAEVSALGSCCQSLRIVLESDFTWSLLLEKRFGAVVSSNPDPFLDKLGLPRPTPLPARFSKYKRLFILLLEQSRVFLRQWQDNSGTTSISAPTFLIGAYKCGKRSLKQRLMENEFFEGQLWNGPAVELCISRWSVDADRVPLTSSSSILPDMSFSFIVWFPTYFSAQQWLGNFRVRPRDCQGALFCFALDDKRSFEDLQRLMARYYDEEGRKMFADAMVLGLRADVPPALRQVASADIAQLQQQFKVRYMETSAKTGLNVQRAFGEHFSALALHAARLKPAELTNNLAAVPAVPAAPAETSKSWCAVS